MVNFKFSVAMSVYKNDDPVFFDRALESILIKQNIIPNEVVLVVDGPVPESIDAVIEKYTNLTKKIKAIRLAKNQGLGNALKVSVENSSYDLIARMDSDDVSCPTRFEEQLKFFKNDKNVDIVGGDITEFIDDEKNIVAKRVVPLNNDDIQTYMKKRCAMNHVTVMFKKKAIMDAGGYLDWHFNEDYYLWIRMCLKHCVFANTGTVLVNVRVGKEMYQRRGGLKYFMSEKKLQKYMLKNNMISYITYFSNVLKRFIVQVILPNKMREWVFKKFARE